MQFVRVYSVGTRYDLYLTVDVISGEDYVCMFVHACMFGKPLVVPYIILHFHENRF